MIILLWKISQQIVSEYLSLSPPAVCGAQLFNTVPASQKPYSPYYIHLTQTNSVPNNIHWKNILINVCLCILHQSQHMTVQVS